MCYYVHITILIACIVFIVKVDGKIWEENYSDCQIDYLVKCA